MNLHIALILALACSAAIAGEGSPCSKMEYAQLKDSSRKELIGEYCGAMAKSQLNQDLKAIQKRLFDSQLNLGVRTDATQRAMVELGNAQVSCLVAADAAAGMLLKKFKAPRPACATK